MQNAHTLDSFSKVENEALRLNDEFKLDTIRFFRNSVEIYRRFNEWKGMDRFYFIPLKLSMTYSVGGVSVSMADGPVYLGTFVRTTLEHPDMFSFCCPECGKVVYPYGYNGSPLSGRVDLQGICNCGWQGYEIVSGWRKRSDVLKAMQAEDKLRMAKFKMKSLLKKQQSTIKELLLWLDQNSV